jgi:hypothetical protein
MLPGAGGERRDSPVGSVLGSAHKRSEEYFYLSPRKERPREKAAWSNPKTCSEPDRKKILMDKEHLHRLVSDPTHIRHLALSFAVHWLDMNCDHITEGEREKHAIEDNEEDLFEVFYDPAKAEIERIAQELRAQAKETEKDCSHRQPYIES